MKQRDKPTLKNGCKSLYIKKGVGAFIVHPLPLLLSEDLSGIIFLSSS